MITEEYAPGRLVDIHGDGQDGVVLLWHGRGSNSRGVVADLAAEIAGHGLRVVAPDWDAGAPDHGRSHLLASLEHARGIAARMGADPDRLTIAGWSLGGTAAVGLVMHASSIGVGLGAIVLLSPGDGPRALDPFTGSPLPDPFPRPPMRVPVHVVSATRDTIATPEIVRGLEARLSAAGWPTVWIDVEADHGSIAMSTYDVQLDQFVPADDAATVATGREVATIVAAATASS